MARLFNRKYMLQQTCSDHSCERGSGREIVNHNHAITTASTATSISSVNAAGSATGPHDPPTVPAEALRSDPLLWLRLRGKRTANPFSFLNFGLLAYVGDSNAVAKVQLGDAGFITTSGKKAFLLWRSVYLVKQVSTRTRFLVLFDYFKTSVFGRDLTNL